MDNNNTSEFTRLNARFDHELNSLKIRSYYNHILYLNITVKDLISDTRSNSHKLKNFPDGKPSRIKEHHL